MVADSCFRSRSSEVLAGFSKALGRAKGGDGQHVSGCETTDGVTLQQWLEEPGVASYEQVSGFKS